MAEGVAPLQTQKYHVKPHIQVDRDVIGPGQIGSAAVPEREIRPEQEGDKRSDYGIDPSTDECAP